MQALRTIIWVLVAIVFVSFVAINWQTVPVNFWPLEEGYLHFNWPVGFVAIIAFVLGFLPVWLLGRANSWRLNRRISNLENSLKAATPAPPLATTTQLTEPAPAVEPAALVPEPPAT
jgi:putative membrane protein